MHLESSFHERQSLFLDILFPRMCSLQKEAYVIWLRYSFVGCQCCVYMRI